jgi:hypothetical protein
MQAMAAYSRRCEIMLANINEEAEVNHHANESLLADLNLYCTCLVKKLKKARSMLSDQQLKLKVIQTAKGKKELSIERKMFKTLKEVWCRTEFVLWLVIKQLGYQKGNEQCHLLF